MLENYQCTSNHVEGFILLLGPVELLSHMAQAKKRRVCVGKTGFREFPPKTCPVSQDIAIVALRTYWGPTIEQSDKSSQGGEIQLQASSSLLCNLGSCQIIHRQNSLSQRRPSDKSMPSSRSNKSTETLIKYFKYLGLSAHRGHESLFVAIGEMAALFHSYQTPTSH